VTVTGTASGAEAATRTRGQAAPPGRAGYAIVPVRPSGAATRSAQLRYRHSTGRAFRYTSPGSDGGRRRASSVVADFPATNHATTLLVRRWDAIGVPEGRGCGAAVPDVRDTEPDSMKRGYP
jgi:hypothetical protein